MARSSLKKNIVRRFGRWVFRDQIKKFDLGQDPYGNPQTPLTPYTIRKKGHSRMLVESGRMRASRTQIYGHNGLKSSMRTPAGLHQDGIGDRLPVRKVFPDTWPSHYVRKAEVVAEEDSFEWGEELANALRKI